MVFPSDLLASPEHYVSSQVSQASGGEGKSSSARRKRRKAKAEAKKRRLSDEQVKFLEMSFKDERKLEAGRKDHLAAEVGLEPKQVAVWFQNRRARHKTKQVEDAYLKLKTAHDAVVVQKCHLENELMNLKEKLSEAEDEIRKLSLGLNAERSGSPCSSLSGVSHHQPLAAATAAAGDGEFGVKGEEEQIMGMQEYNFTNYMMMEYWANFYGV